MTLEQEGAYRRLMDVCWLENGLPTDMEQLWRLAKAPSKERFVKHIWPVVGRKFRTKRGQLRHKRLDEERSKQAKNRKKKQLAAEARWEQEQCTRNADASPVQCLSSSFAFASSSAEKRFKPTAAKARRDSRDVEKLLKTPEAGNEGRGPEGNLVSATMRDSKDGSSAGAVDRGFGMEGTDAGHIGEVGLSGAEHRPTVSSDGVSGTRAEANHRAEAESSGASAEGRLRASGGPSGILQANDQAGGLGHRCGADGEPAAGEAGLRRLRAIVRQATGAA